MFDRLEQCLVLFSVDPNLRGYHRVTHSALRGLRFRYTNPNGLLLSYFRWGCRRSRRSEPVRLLDRTGNYPYMHACHYCLRAYGPDHPLRAADTVHGGYNARPYPQSYPLTRLHGSVLHEYQ